MSQDGQTGEIDKLGSMLDVFPTVLDWLGLLNDVSGAGIGRSLLSDTPTLTEELGQQEIGTILSRDALLSAAIWGVDGPEE